MDYKSLKQKVYIIVEKDDDSFLSKAFDIIIVAVILLNVFALTLETVPEYNSKYGDFFHSFEKASIIIFTIEYILRLWVITENKRFKQPILGRLKYVFTFSALVDLFAIIPFFFYAASMLDGRILRLVRVLRLLRILKLNRYSKSAEVVAEVLRSKSSELIVSITWIFILLLLSSSFMYFAEHEAQPEAFSSIPSAMWWGVITLTTVGYGDIVPITVFGKFIGGIIALLGIGAFALPAGILANGFSEVIKKKNQEDDKQQH